MPRHFIRCKGKSLCKESETECRTCGRRLDETYTIRRLTDELAGFIVDMDYDNTNEFMHYLVSKVIKKVDHLDDLKQEAVANGYH